jgi:hypothetical protein
MHLLILPFTVQNSTVQYSAAQYTAAYNILQFTMLMRSYRYGSGLVRTKTFLFTSSKTIDFILKYSARRLTTK